MVAGLNLPRALKRPRTPVEVPAVHPSQCPLCGTAVHPEIYSGGSHLLRCANCGASWEVHNSLVRRISDPDWSKVDAAHAEHLADGDAPATPAPIPRRRRLARLFSRG